MNRERIVPDSWMLSIISIIYNDWIITLRSRIQTNQAAQHNTTMNKQTNQAAQHNTTMNKQTNQAAQYNTTMDKTN